MASEGVYNAQAAKTQGDMPVCEHRLSVGSTVPQSTGHSFDQILGAVANEAQQQGSRNTAHTLGSVG
jgi:hypothetical protein